VIEGVHTILYASDAEAARAFFRDVLEMESVDAGGGWLIFALPPGELACHPGPGIVEGREEGRTELFLMCRDVEDARTLLEERGVQFTEAIADEGYGLITRLVVPGFGPVGLYQPTHESPLKIFQEKES
jgi:catechol 2,3-dioxygenase-like lactoylglutathione lyase family enzyme